MYLSNKESKSGAWFVVYGRGKKESLGTKDEQKAKKLFAAKTKELSLRAAEEAKPKRAPKISAYAERYAAARGSLSRHTLRADDLHLRTLAEKAGDLRLDQVTPEVAEVHVATLPAGTRPTALNHLRAAFSKAVKWGLIRSNPFADVQVRVERQAPERVPTLEEVERIREKAGPEMARLIDAYNLTGHRRESLLLLTWGDVDEASQTLWLAVKGSSGTKRPYPLPPSLIVALGPRGAAGDRVFPQWEHPDTVTHLFKEAAREAGLEWCHLHLLRHAWNTRMAEAGTPEHLHLACSGHLTREMRDHYGKIRDRALLQSAIEKANAKQ